MKPNYKNSLPKLDLTKLKTDIKDISSESHVLKKKLRRTPVNSPEYREINDKVISLKRKMTFLCSLRSMYSDRVHLLDKLEKAVRYRFELMQMMTPYRNINRNLLVVKMLELQEDIVMSKFDEVRPYVKD